MRDVLSSLIGVPGTILVAAGLGIVGVTLVSRVLPSRTSIRWAHLVLGVGFLGCGIVLVGLDISLLGTP